MLRLDLSAGRYLRPFDEADAEALFAVVDANRAHVGRCLAFVASTREATHSLEWIRGTHKQLADKRGVQLAIVDAEAIVGVVGIWAIDDARSATVGYWIAEDRQGRGIVSEALSALIAHTFQSLAVHRLELRAAVDNERSKAVAHRLGFTLEGILREAERRGDEYVDVAVYSLLSGERRAEGRVEAGMAQHSKARS